MKIARWLPVVAVLSVSLTPGVVLADDVVFADLIATDAEPQASGCAFFDAGTDPDHDHEELFVHVEGVISTDTVDVWLDEVPIITGIGLTDGEFTLDLTDLAIIEPGSIQIVDSYSGTLLLSGLFEG